MHVSGTGDLLVKVRNKESCQVSASADPGSQGLVTNIYHYFYTLKGNALNNEAQGFCVGGGLRFSTKPRTLQINQTMCEPANRRRVQLRFIMTNTWFQSGGKVNTAWLVFEGMLLCSPIGPARERGWAQAAV